jgi:hypothetical protein
LGSDITWTAGGSEVVIRGPGGIVVEKLGRLGEGMTVTAGTSEVVLGSNVVVKGLDGPDGVAGVKKGWVGGMDADVVETRDMSVVDSSDPVWACSGIDSVDVDNASCKDTEGIMVVVVTEWMGVDVATGSGGES